MGFKKNWGPEAARATKRFFSALTPSRNPSNIMTRSNLYLIIRIAIQPKINVITTSKKSPLTVKAERERKTMMIGTIIAAGTKHKLYNLRY